MKKYTITKRLLSLLLCAALLLGYMPASKAATLARATVAGTVTDPGTADGYEHMLGSDIDGNRYAGRVWADKSVYKDGDTVVLSNKGGAGSAFEVELAEDEAFQIVFSALGSTMTTTETRTSTGPMDVVLILDNSVSMNTTSGGTTRMQKVIEAANKLLKELLDGNDIRLGITAYSENASTILPFGTYKDGVVLKVNSYTGTGNRNGVITAYNENNQVINSNYKSAGYANYTNTQAGFELAMQMLSGANKTAGRKPVVILLTDGAANTALDTLFVSGKTGTVRQIYHSNDIDPMIALSTLLSAAYHKATVEDRYGNAPMVYGIGVDLSATDGSNAIVDPANHFRADNRNRNIQEAYEVYTQVWQRGDEVSVSSGTGFGWGSSSYTFRFGHEYPQGSAVTDQDIIDNLAYVDTYYPVASADLQGVFDQIYEELSSGVFNPITSSSSVSGGTGVDDTPLIYVDFIGQHMEIKKIQSVTLFGASYGVIQKADGSYAVTKATGINPTTNEKWNTEEDISIAVIPQADGTQKLEIRINQEILPIILEQVVSETVGEISKSTITEYAQEPLRIYYTVGVAEDILLSGGEVDVSKLQGYEHIDDTTGTVTFYSNRFGVENTADADGTVAKGDAHVGFQPSPANRYYYHQVNQGIFTKISDKSGNPVTIPENNAYGIIWDENTYDLTWMSYDEYLNAQPEDTVYTYVSYFRPTEHGSNAAEEITYLVYTHWKYLKESVAFYDAAAKAYINGGKVATEAQADAYIAENPGAEIYAVLGVGSRRTSRLHNMMVGKTENATGTAQAHYTPEYLENKSQHNDNDVVIWLGNNGKLTVQIETGIALTKAVTENIGDPDDTYALTVTIPDGVAATPAVVDKNGAPVASTYENNVLTVELKAAETVYISGIPGGTECLIGEIIHGDYYIADKTDSVRVPLVSQVLSGAAQFAPAVVTNAPYKYGNLFITKEITSDHAVPENVLSSEFTFTVNVGAELAGTDLTVSHSAHPAPYTVTVDDGGNLAFLLKARQTVEIFQLPEGTAVTVTEATPDDHFAVSYRTRNHSGENADEDNAVTIPAGGNATAVVLNHYTPTPASADLDIIVNKDFADASVADRLEGGDFTFLVEKHTGSQPLAEATIRYDAEEYGEKTVTIADVLKNETYTEVGTYSYKVSEVRGAVSNVTYDRTIYTFDVVVTDEGGQLTATVMGMGNAVLSDENGDGITDYITSFVNTYETAPISMDIEKHVVNKSGDSTVSAQGFRFQSIAVDAEGNPLGAPENTIFSDAAGEARISGVYTREQIGTHYYLVYETDDGRPGWTYSGAEYFVTVEVAEDPVTGKLAASMTIAPHNAAAEKENAPTVTDGNCGKLHFTNTYTPKNVSVDLDGHVRKVLTGKSLEDDQFTFHVYKDGDRSKPVITGTNKFDGNVHFVDFNKALTFSGVGMHRYDVVENIPEKAQYDEATGTYVLDGMRYDPTIYDLVVEVINDVTTGELTANYYFEDAVDNVVTFRNSYRAEPTRYALGGVKILRGRAPRNGEFTFELYADGILLQTVTNRADGSFRFDAIDYTDPGTYTYTIQEAAGDVAGIRYDGAEKPVTVQVTVTDIGGALQATADKANANIKFENTYEAKPARVTFTGTKALIGDQLQDGAFNFLLYRTDNSFDITADSAKLVDSVKNENGGFRFSQSLSDTGTYYFTVLEDTSNPAEGIVYDRTRHIFAVQVSDNGNGQLLATVTNLVTGITSAADASVSASVSFVNATFHEATEKEVFLAGTITEIDGKRVSEGDILTYHITYTNYTGENVTVDIMDTIPNHTTYVEGSADMGGTYAGTHLSWILDVPKGESITVSFNVRVDESKVIVPNTAVIRDGVNTYYTNEVVNHTVVHQLEKDVFYPAAPTVSIDGQKVYQGEELLYKLSFTNTTAKAVGVTISDRIPENTTYVEGSADKGGVYENGVVTWQQTVPAWATVTVSFQVKVNENIGAATIQNQGTASDGTNSYETRWVTNYTVVDQVAKDVFREKAPTVSIDGKKVRQDEVLLYTISYTNTAAETAAVTITDTVPQYTTYVEGSATNGGVLADNTLTWTLTVDAGSTVTVSFKVKVDRVRSATITNRATVLEGRNTYETNQVTNPTNNSGGSGPQTGDNSHLLLWFMLLFVSGGAVVVLMTCGKKQNESETENN